MLAKDVSEHRSENGGNKTDRIDHGKRNRTQVKEINVNEQLIPNSQSSADVEGLAIRKADLGPGATVVSIKRKSHDCHDLVVLVTSASGDKEITVTRRMLARETSKKVEPQACPGCGSEPEGIRDGSKWKWKCSANKGLHSVCKKEGHWMFSRKDAVRVWNEVK